MLPFKRDSIDCILAPLTLQCFNLNKNPIDEIDRVLKPMGYLVIFGTNPIVFGRIFKVAPFIPRFLFSN